VSGLQEEEPERGFKKLKDSIAFGLKKNMTSVILKLIFFLDRVLL
jgi:hypothetical protein